MSFVSFIVLMLKRHWRKILIGLGIAAVIGFVGFTFRSCFTPKPVEVDQEKLQKVNSKIATERKQELRDMVYENAETVQTVDGRTSIAETNIVERDRLVEEKIDAVDAKIIEAKKQGRDVTGPELECMLTGVCDE